MTLILPAAALFLVGPSLSEVHGEEAADFGIAQVRLINEHVRRAWEDNELRPAPDAGLGEWCRRVYLDVIGRIPTVAELDEFLRDRGPDRKRRLVDRLLGDEYAVEYARYWTGVWTNLLIGRADSSIDDDLTSRDGMQAYLRESFAVNKPYDVMVGELLTATGGTRPDGDEFNGATNFLVGKLEDGAVQATAKTSQLFLGMQVQCTQCHNHPFNEYKQNQFWELNAFFRQTRALRSYTGRDISGVRLVDEYFPGESGKSPENAEIYYELRNNILKAAYPVFIDGTSLAELYENRGETFGNSGRVEDVNRRTELAKLVVESPWLGKSLANRMWGHFLGYGFNKPVDDMGPHNPPTHPELLDALGAELRGASFDLKQLIRWIVLSEPYGLSSRMAREHVAKDDPTAGARPLFSHFYLRQMEAEQLYESLLIATEADQTVASEEERTNMKRQWLAQFVSAFGTDEGDESTTFNGSIPQSLMMMNGPLVKRACGTEPGSFLYKVAAEPKLSNQDRIEYLYKAALARVPTGMEVAAANRLVLKRKGNTAEALQDVWWALLNSNEFILNH
jgi:hypothetical protein